MVERVSKTRRRGALVVLGAVLGIGQAAGCEGSRGGSSAPPASQTVAVTPPPAQQPGGQAPAAGDQGPVTGSGPARGLTGDPLPGTEPAAPGAAGGSSGTVAQALVAAAGSRVAVRALYLGWSGPCRKSPPSRSAWQLADAEAVGAPCMYVVGPMVQGVSPSNALGKNVWVRAEGVVTGEGDARYLQADRVERE